MRFLYFGLPLGALRLAAEGFVPAAACIGHPDAPGMRRVRRTLGARGVLVLGRPDLDDAAVRRTLLSCRAEAILSWFWPRLIPGQLLDAMRRGAFGVHPSLLPRWRGPDPYFWTVRRGDRETGVTLHRLETSYDTGALIASRRLKVKRGEDSWQLARRLDRPSLGLLLDCARRLARGETLEGSPQDESLATEAPRPSDDDLAIDWRTPAREIVRLVRAAAPWPGATARIGEHDVEVIAARAVRAVPRALEPSEAWRSPEGVVVKAQKGGVLLVAVRLRDGRTLRGEDIERLLSEG